MTVVPKVGFGQDARWAAGGSADGASLDRVLLGAIRRSGCRRRAGWTAAGLAAHRGAGPGATRSSCSARWAPGSSPTIGPRSLSAASSGCACTPATSRSVRSPPCWCSSRWACGARSSGSSFQDATPRAAGQIRRRAARPRRRRRGQGRRLEPVQALGHGRGASARGHRRPAAGAQHPRLPAAEEGHRPPLRRERAVPLRHAQRGRGPGRSRGSASRAGARSRGRDRRANSVFRFNVRAEQVRPGELVVRAAGAGRAPPPEPPERGVEAELTARFLHPHWLHLPPVEAEVVDVSFSGLGSRYEEGTRRWTRGSSSRWSSPTAMTG